MDWITDEIAIGNIEDAMNRHGLREAGIRSVLCLNGFPTLRGEDFEWAGVPLIDGPGNSIDEVFTAVRRLHELVESPRVMVHCAEGLSRSALVVSCFLSERHGLSFDEAVGHVTLRRPRAQIDQALLDLIAPHWR